MMVQPNRWALAISLLVALLTATAGEAHVLEVTILLPGPVQPGQPPLSRTETVPHKHVCSHRFVLLEDGRLALEHFREMTAPEMATVNGLAADWITKNGGGNIEHASPPTYDKNCHGVTFDNGNSWVDDPGPFLERCTRWSPPPATPPVGTVVVYRNDGQVTHTGRVIQTPPGKNGVWVFSQWGHWGDFNHRVDVVHEIYGTPSYYTCP